MILQLVYLHMIIRLVVTQTPVIPVNPVTTGSTLVTTDANLSETTVDIISTSTSMTVSEPITEPTREFEETPIPLNTDIGVCTCDLTASWCDINCCCDSDCTSSDFDVFSKCDDLPATPPATDLCSYTVKVFKNNAVVEENANNSNIFCIYSQQNVARNFYTPVGLVRSAQTFDDHLKNVNQFNYDYQYQLPQTLNLNTAHYKSGQILVTVTSGSARVFPVPTSVSASTTCIEMNPAKFLEDQSNSCMRILVGDLATSCDNTAELNAVRVREKLDKVEFPVRPDGDIKSVISINITGQSEPSLQSTVYNSTIKICFGVVTKVDYTVYHTGGVLQIVEAYITMQDLSGDLTAVEQQYSIKFLDINAPDTGPKRSGNPGYLIGAPLIAGKIVDNEFIELNGNRDQYLTMISSTANGDCIVDGSSRISIRFGENVRSGCMLALTEADITTRCEYFKTQVLESLLGSTRTLVNTSDTLYIASFGNSNPLKIGDWVKVFISSSLLDTDCVGLPESSRLGIALHLEILYAKVGSVYNPQSRIVGARLHLEPITVDFLCVGSYCQSHTTKSTQNFEMVSSVAFIDISNPAEAVVAARPVTNSKLGARFFHPYYTMSAGTSPCADVVRVLFLVLCAKIL